MKYLVTFIVMLFAGNILMAQDNKQEYKIQAANTRDGKLTLNDFPSDLPIEGYSGNEIIITSNSDHPGPPPERAKGLKPIYPGGEDNTGMGLFVEKNGNDITIQCLLPITQQGSYKVKVPDNFSLKVKGGCERSIELTVQNMKNEIEANVCHNISLKNVTGPLVLSTISGNITVAFTELSKDKSISIASVSGEIDVTLPAKAAMNVELGTMSGSMYSDFDFSNDKKEMKRIGGSSIQGQLNGGGVDVKITNVSGNIYLRKG